MLIVEELHLLFLRSDGRTESAVSGYRMYGEIAAVIVDLVMHGRITVSDDKSPKLIVEDASPTGHPVLDATLERLVPLAGRALSSLISRPKLDPRRDVADALIAQGVLVRGERGFFGGERTPESDPGPEARLRQRLAEVIAGTTPPSTADRTLLAILKGLSAVRALLREEVGELKGAELRRRIDELTAPSPAGDAVESAVDMVVLTVVIDVLLPLLLTTMAAAAAD